MTSNGVPSNFFNRSNRIRVDLLSYESKRTEKREIYDWRAEKIIASLRDLSPEIYLIDTQDILLRKFIIFADVPFSLRHLVHLPVSARHNTL